MKVFEPDEEEGIVVSYRETERMFRQKNGVVQEMPVNSLFPSDPPPELKNATYGPYYIFESFWFNEPCVVIKSTVNDDRIDSTCSMVMKNICFLGGTGDRCWFIGESMEYNVTMLCYMDAPISNTAPSPCYSRGIMSPVRLVSKY